MLADVLCAWEVEAQQVAAVIGHALILTRVALTMAARRGADQAAADTELVGKQRFRRLDKNY